MEVRFLEKSKDGLTILFLVKGINSQMANTLRRAIIDEVPTMAIETVEFKKNNSILYDEIIAHRLGLITLKTNLKSYNFPSECKCNGEGCARCQTTIVIKTSKAGNITASEMKPKDTSVTPVYPNTVITKLHKGQSLECVSTAVLGVGKEHSKWCPAHVYYYNEPKITVNNDNSLLEKYKHKYPESIFDKSGKVDKNLINSPSLIDAVEDVSKLIEIERKEDSFIFVVESWGQLAPKVIVMEAINQINKQLDEMVVLIK